MAQLFTSGPHRQGRCTFILSFPSLFGLGLFPGASSPDFWPAGAWSLENELRWQSQGLLVELHRHVLERECQGGVRVNVHLPCLWGPEVNNCAMFYLVPLSSNWEWVLVALNINLLDIVNFPGIFLLFCFLAWLFYRCFLGSTPKPVSYTHLTLPTTPYV